MLPRRVFLIRSDGPGWSGLRADLDASAGVEVVGDTSSAATARTRVLALRPDFVITGRTVETTTVVPLLTELRAVLPDTAFVVISGRHTHEDLLGFAPLYPVHFLNWDDLSEPSFHGAREAMRGGAFTVWSLDAFGELMEILLHRRSMAAPVHIALSPREREVLARVAAGDTDDDTARHLGISRTTVRSHVENLEQKLHAKNRPHLIHLAWSCGLLDLRSAVATGETAQRRSPASSHHPPRTPHK
jgi:DNA-binding NarL/FixJ family response regulator